MKRLLKARCSWQCLLLRLAVIKRILPPAGTDGAATSFIDELFVKAGLYLPMANSQFSFSFLHNRLHESIPIFVAEAGGTSVRLPKK